GVEHNPLAQKVGLAMLERIRHMLIKEFIQVLRDPRMRGVIFLAPIFQLLILSYAITTDIRNISLAVFDQDRTVASRQLVERFSGSGYFVVERQLTGESEIREMLDGSRVQIVLRI